MVSTFSGHSGVYHWSPLELEIVDKGNNYLIKKLFIIGAHWSPLELENSDGINIFCRIYHWSPLESIGVGDCK